MSRRTGSTTEPRPVLADDRIPFPHTETATRCRTEPRTFAIEDVPHGAQRDKALTRARRACSECPIVTGCLKWALANPGLTPTGVWAATTARQRIALRRQLTDRLGDDWVDVVATQDRQKQQRKRAARLAPPTVREQALARLELELLPSRPAPYEPASEPLTPSRQAHNRRQLLAALKANAWAAA